MKMHRAVLIGCCAMLLGCCAAVAQDQPAAPTGTTAAPGADVNVADQTTATPSTAPDPLAVHSLGNLFSVDTSVWRFGPFHLNSASVGEGYYLGNSNGQDFSSSTTNFDAVITFDHRIKRARFTFQFQPQLYIIDGNVLNGSETDLNLNTGYQLSSTVNLNLYDSFGSRGNQTPNGISFSPTASPFVQVDPTTGKFYQSPFTTGAGHSYYNTGGATIDWRATQRLTLSLNGSAGYSWYGEGDGNAVAASGLDSTTIQGGTNASYALNARRAISAGFTYEQSRISSLTDLTSLYNFSLGYSETIGRSWHYSLSGGGVATDDGVRPITWGGTGSATISKTFHSGGSLGVTAGRQLSAGGPFITASTYDRADATYSQNFGRLWSAGAGVGYFRGKSPGISQSARGKYGSGQVSYQVRGNIQVYVSCSRFFQNGDGLQLIQTRAWQFGTGLRWYPSSKGGDSR
jgi:hypothetical protein